MTKITIDITDEEDKKLKHLIVEKDISSKARFIEEIVREYLKENQ